MLLFVLLFVPRGMLLWILLRTLSLDRARDASAQPGPRQDAQVRGG
jgi:hypothetical protein